MSEHRLYKKTYTDILSIYLFSYNVSYKDFDILNVNWENILNNNCY